MKNSLPYQINRMSGGGHGKGFQVTQNSQADNTVLTFKNRGTGDEPKRADRTIFSTDQLAKYFPGTPLEPISIPQHYPMKIPPYYLSLVKKPGDPLWRQAVPDPVEQVATRLVSDPLDEERQSPVPGLIHRYPDRVVFLVSDSCAMHCRHCMRRRKISLAPQERDDNHRRAIAYIRQQPNIREVILSGGDPFMLPDRAIVALLEKLHAIAHVALLRIHTRIPCTLPERITPQLAGMLKRFLLSIFNLITPMKSPRLLRRPADCWPTPVSRWGVRAFS